MNQWAFLLRKVLLMTVGLFIFGTGSYLGIQANIGLGAWEAFQTGLSDLTGITYGNISLIVGAFIVILDIVLKEKIGFGTVMNAVIIGKTVDFWNWVGLLPKMDNFFVGLIMLLVGQTMISIGTYLYIREGLGGGPRDSLMTAIGRRIPNLSIGVARGILEGTVLIIGYLLGAKVGIGTVICVCGISFIMQTVFKVFKFDIKKVKHENFAMTIRGLKEGNWHHTGYLRA